MLEEKRIKKKYINGNRCQYNPQGRPKNRWEDDIRNDKKKLKKKNRKSCIQDLNKWKSYV